MFEITFEGKNRSFMKWTSGLGILINYMHGFATLYFENPQYEYYEKVHLMINYETKTYTSVDIVISFEMLLVFSSRETCFLIG